MFKPDLEKAEEPEIKLPASVRPQIKQGNSRKNIYFCFSDYTKAFDFVDHNKLWEIQETGIPDHLGNLYTGQEAIVRTRQGKMSQLQFGIGVLQLYIVTLLFNFMWSTSCECWDGWLTNWNQDCQININNLTCADDTSSLQRAKMNWRISWLRWKNRVKMLA